MPTPPNTSALVTFRLVQVGDQYRYDAVLFNPLTKTVGVIAQGTAGSVSGLTAAVSAMTGPIKSFLAIYQSSASNVQGERSSGISRKGVDPVSVGLIINGHDRGYVSEFARIRYAHKSGLQLVPFKAKVSSSYVSVADQDIYEETQVRAMMGIVGVIYSVSNLRQGIWFTSRVSVPWSNKIF